MLLSARYARGIHGVPGALTPLFNSGHEIRVLWLVLG